MQFITVTIESFGAIKTQLPDFLQQQCMVGSSVLDLLQQLADHYPQSATLLDRCACAIDADLISRETILNTNTKLVLLSPVAGG